MYGTHKKKYDVSANIEVAKLLELAQNECNDSNVVLELCIDEAADQWSVVKDPVSLKKGDKLRVKKVTWIEVLLICLYVRIGKI